MKALGEGKLREEKRRCGVYLSRGSGVVAMPLYMLYSALLLCTARSELCKVLCLILSLTFLFVYEISPEALNGFAPNSLGRRVWSLTQRV